MSSLITLTRTIYLVRWRAQRNLRYMNLGMGLLLIVMMYVMTSNRATQVAPTESVVEFSAWRILVGLVVTIISTALSEIGSIPERDFLKALGVKGTTYLWSKWIDLGFRSLPWLFWGLAWGLSISIALPGRPYGVMTLYTVALYILALSIGGVVGFGLESMLRRFPDGQRTSKFLAMIAPFAMVAVMMGLGTDAPVPAWLQTLSGLTPIQYFQNTAFGRVVQSTGASVAMVATFVPWLLALWFIGARWSFPEDTQHTQRGRTRAREREMASWGRFPFVVKDLLMLKRNGFTLFRGVFAAVVLVVPFAFLNTRAELPSFLLFFEVMIIVAASGMMFGLMLPTMDREVMWLIRSSGQLRSYVLQKFCLIVILTTTISTLIVGPLSMTLHLPLGIILSLVLVGSWLISSLSLMASSIADRLGVDMVHLPDANIVMGTMLVFGMFLTTAVLAYTVSWPLYVGALLIWAIAGTAGIGLTMYLYQTTDQ